MLFIAATAHEGRCFKQPEPLKTCRRILKLPTQGRRNPDAAGLIKTILFVERTGTFDLFTQVLFQQVRPRDCSVLVTFAAANCECRVISLNFGLIFSKTEDTSFWISTTGSRLRHLPIQ